MAARAVRLGMLRHVTSLQQRRGRFSRKLVSTDTVGNWFQYTELLTAKLFYMSSDKIIYGFIAY